MAECDNCGAHVSASFHRVHANPDGTLYSCMDCAPNTAHHGVPSGGETKYSPGHDLRIGRMSGTEWTFDMLEDNPRERER